MNTYVNKNNIAGSSVEESVGKYGPFIRLSLLLLMGTVMFAACTKDPTALKPDDSDTAMVTFSVKVPGIRTPETRGREGAAAGDAGVTGSNPGDAATRAMTTADEAAVAEMDILLFDIAANGGQLVYHAVAGEVTIDDNRKGTFTVQLPIGTYDMVMIANARTEVAALVPTYPSTRTKESLQVNLIFNSTSEWPAGTDPKPIPMWAEQNGVVVSAGTQITGVALTRAMAKINVEVTTPDFVLNNVYLMRQMQQGYVIPSPANWSGTPPKAHTPSLAANWTRNTGSARYYFPTNNVTATGCINEIYTFETPPGDGSSSNGSGITSGNTFLLVGGRYKGETTTTYYRIDFATQSSTGEVTYLPLLRNHRYEVQIKDVMGRGASMTLAQNAPPVNLTTEIVVKDEADMKYYVYDDQYFIGAGDRFYLVSQTGGNFAFDVRTDHPQGWTAQVSDSQSDPSAGLTGNWLTLNTSSGGLGTTSLDYTVAINGDLYDVDRTAYIHLTAGTLSAVVKVEQLHKFDLGTIPLSPFFRGYVGAFWRANQSGERLIRILRDNQSAAQSIVGDWTATVIQGEDWIVMDTEMSKDNGIEWRGGSSPADMNAADATYRVSGTATTVSGTCADTDGASIYFRIGLRSSYTPTADAPARYGLILLKYANHEKNAVIFVRQGHDPDYLMRPEDPTGNGSLPVPDEDGRYRPLAVKWSPYNLTAAAFNNGGNSEYVQLQVRGGVFTNYPTQAGAFFQYYHVLHIRYAWHPNRTTTQNQNTSAAKYWDDIKDTYETCPSGYRRVFNGFTNSYAQTTAANSELLQSLWYNTPIYGGVGSELTDHLLRGYLADGYFDRRTIKNSTSTQSIMNSTVSGDANSANIAFWGWLIYNPENFANLFFPLTGYRYTAGPANHQGGLSNILTGSVNGSNASSVLSFTETTVSSTSHALYSGLTLRCVKERN